LKELGDYLKEVRKSNGVGIEEASDDLNISPNVLKNLEDGNTRMFRDMLELKETVKRYAKYLGLDSEKVVDEFNDFLFEHTSKISLNDILEAEKEQKKEKKQNEVTSPYTTPTRKYKTPNNNFRVLGITILSLLFILIIIILIAVFIPKKTVVNRELLSNRNVRGEIYECSK